MNINDLLIKDVMIMDLQATDKKARLMKWSKIIRWWYCISDIDTYKEGILKREAQTSTGLATASLCLTQNSAVKEPTVLSLKVKRC